MSSCMSSSTYRTLLAVKLPIAPPRVYLHLQYHVTYSLFSCVAEDCNSSHPVLMLIATVLTADALLCHYIVTCSGVRATVGFISTLVTISLSHLSTALLLTYTHTHAHSSSPGTTIKMQEVQVLHMNEAV
jgi:hypothetical protein